MEICDAAVRFSREYHVTVIRDYTCTRKSQAKFGLGERRGFCAVIGDQEQWRGLFLLFASSFFDRQIKREKERERDNFNSECAVNEEYRQLGEFLPWKKIVRERNRELLTLSLSLKTSSQTIRSN